MNIEILGIIFAVASIILLFYGLMSFEKAILSYFIAVGINVLFLLPFDYLINEEARFLRIPIAYLPIIASMIASIIMAKLQVNYVNKRSLLVFFVFISYLLVQSLFVITDYSSFLQYYIMWVLNLFSMFAVAYLFSSLPIPRAIKLLKLFVFLLAFCCFIGIAKFILGISRDANFMPLMNRNGSIFLVVMIFPLIFMLNDMRLINKLQFYSIILIYIVCIALIGSRMGIFGIIFSSIFYFIFKYRFNIVKICASLITIIILLSLIIASPFGSLVMEGIEKTKGTLSHVALGDFESNMGDYVRYQLLIYGLEVIKENPLLGTGVGLGNYQNHIRKLYPIREAKPHNFYISYLAEFGLIGFGIFIYFLYSIWKNISKLKGDHIWSVPSIIAFRTMFLVMMFMFTMNEYVSFPLLWTLWGLGLGFLHQISRLNFS